MLCVLCKDKKFLVYFEIKMKATNAMKWSVKLTCSRMKKQATMMKNDGCDVKQPGAKKQMAELCYQQRADVISVLGSVKMKARNAMNGVLNLPATE